MVVNPHLRESGRLPRGAKQATGVVLSECGEQMPVWMVITGKGDPEELG